MGSGLHPRRAEKERDLCLPWHRKGLGAGAAQSNLYLDSTLLEPDFDDSSFIPFPHSPRGDAGRDMGGPASPIDIATPTRHASSSPASQNKTSNLTSALQGATFDPVSAGGAMNIGQSGSNGFDAGSGAGRHDSFSGASGFGSQWGGAGAKPISMKNANREKPRRESVAGSLVGGMSWGGVSVGSWIRDE